ncbi:gastrin-releasing peptide [Varanus komodoensis]|nr:gastrin-releasing peptide [Varanus komodoensis]
MARPALQLLPKPRRLFSLLALAAVALSLDGRAASAAPLQGSGTPMAKIYPRGSHWAVGHFMGKKSTGEFPYVYEEQNAPPLSSVLDEDELLGDSLHWREMFKQFLRLLEGNESQNAHILREDVPFSTKGAWEAEDKKSFKDMMDSLLQVMDRKETTPS